VLQPGAENDFARLLAVRDGVEALRRLGYDDAIDAWRRPPSTAAFLSRLFRGPSTRVLPTCRPKNRQVRGRESAGSLSRPRDGRRETTQIRVECPPMERTYLRLRLAPPS
jgi:hypothetical protein